MIPLSHSIVTLKPARQAALQAIVSVDERRKNGAKYRMCVLFCVCSRAVVA